MPRGDFLKRFYQRYIWERGKETYFISFIFFLLAIIFSRLIVLNVERGSRLFGFFYIKNYHIHHFYWGVIILIISHWLAIIRYRRIYRRYFRAAMSVAFGIGLGLIVDEIGLFLTMEFGIKGDYWAPQSYYAMLLVSGIFLYFLLRGGKRGRETSSPVRAE